MAKQCNVLKKLAEEDFSNLLRFESFSLLLFERPQDPNSNERPPFSTKCTRTGKV